MLRSAVLALALAFAAPALAEPAPALHYVHPAAGFQVDIPTDWQASTDASGKLSVNAPDGTLNVAFHLVPAKDAEKALGELNLNLAKGIKKLSFDKAGTPTTLNGLSALLVNGAGELNGQPVQLGVALVKLPTQAVILLGIISPKGEKHRAALSRLIQSMKPAKP